MGRDALGEHTLVVSIAAGITLRQLAEGLGGERRVVQRLRGMWRARFFFA